MRKNLVFVEVTSNELVRLLDYEVNTVEEEEDGTIVEFTKKIDNVFIGRKVNFTDDCIFMSQEYVIDVLPKQE